MILLYMVLGAIGLSIVLYTYGYFLSSSTMHGRGTYIQHEGRDMWAASLLDCEYEPAKVRFGPAKIIPAKDGIHRSTSDKSFSTHMASK